MKTVSRHIGLTGGIGSGKSTVAALLASRGAAVVDADALSRELTAPGGAALAPIVEAFGELYIATDGALDRGKMRELVFAKPQAKFILEGIIHPLVAAATAKAAAAAEAAGTRCVVFDVPLLVESGRWRAQVQEVLVVDCTEASQVRRVMARSGWSEDAVRSVMSAQASRAQRLAAADCCLYNDGISLAELAAQVRELAARFGL